MPEHDLVLDPDDLIDDEEIKEPESDLLAHERIAEQLDALTATVPSPSNIALYGAWGSGKSGIGRLLEARVLARKGSRFARFDAFKFAETPLRRNFISAVASALEIRDEKFHHDLYSGHTSTELSLPVAKWLKIVGVFLGIVVTLTALLVALVAFVAIFMSHDYGDDFRGLAKAVVAAGVVPAALLAGLITLANKSIQVDRSITRPESDEQFEALFEDLVKQSKAKRLVVFVDELDRCGSDEVVATLDAIRTFLGVTNCIFVIAADQRVLEEALTKAARQETPANDVNPYYSTGSAYLDKVFQYQVSVPPLLTQSITRYAAGLVEGRGGVWSLPNTSYVVSILIPAHVTSPRRVKHLLNAYALAYRLAEDRHRQGLLTEDPATNRAGLARLVCLRVEFPLFARHLIVDARLPQMVLDLVSNPGYEWNISVSEEAKDVARRFADKKAPGAQMLTDDGGGKDATSASELVARESNRQLIAYLRRTKAVRGPSRDLVFMQSTGTDFGLDGQVALEIETASQNGDGEAIAERLRGGDESFRDGVLRMLVHQMRTAVGVESTNAARSFLAAMGSDPGLSVTAVADAASEAINLVLEDEELLDNDLTAVAWRLASAGQADASIALRRTILEAIAASDSDVRGTFILAAPRGAVAVDTALLAQIAAKEIVSTDCADAMEALAGLRKENLVDVLIASSVAIGDALNEAASARAAFEDAETPDETLSEADSENGDDESEPLDPRGIYDSLQRLAVDYGDGDVSDRVIETLLRANDTDSRNAVAALLTDPAIAPVRHSSAVMAVIGPQGVQRRNVSHMLPWFRGVDPEAIQGGHRRALQATAEALWTSMSGDDTTSDSDRAALMSAFVTLVERLPLDQRPDLTPMASGAFTNTWAKDDTTAMTQSRLMRQVILFGRAGLLDPAPPLTEAVGRLADSIAVTTDAPILPDSPFGVHLRKDALQAIHGASLQGETGRALLKSIFSEVDSSPCVAEPTRQELVLAYTEASGFAPEGLEVDLSASDLVSLIDVHGSATTGLVGLWLRVLKPPREEVTSVLAALEARKMLVAELHADFAVARAEWPADEQAQFLSDHLSDPTLNEPDDAELEVLGFWTADALVLADTLIRRFEAATNNGERQATVGLWRRAKVTDSSAIKRLVNGIAIPLFELNHDGTNAQAAGIGFAALDLLTTLPNGVKGTLGKAVSKAVDGNSTLEKRAARVMGALGYRIEKSGLFARKSKPRYDT